MHRLGRSWWLLAGLLAWSSEVRAHGGGGGGYTPDASDLPAGPLKRQILDVEQRVQNQKHKPELVKQPLGDALRAAERARGARASGDRLHGSLLDKLGEQWVKVANALLRAVEIERKAATEARRARELRLKVERAQALLAEQHARVGRLQAEVKSLEAKVKGDAVRTKEQEKERLGGSKPAPAPSPAPKKKGAP
jgi:hypothetical protein